MKKKNKKRKVTLSSPEQLKKYGFDEPFNYDFDFKAKASSKASKLNNCSFETLGRPIKCGPKKSNND